jgi:hypothetical protein
MQNVKKDIDPTAAGREQGAGRVPAHVSGPEWRGNTRLTQTQDGALRKYSRSSIRFCNSHRLGRSHCRRRCPPRPSSLSSLWRVPLVCLSAIKQYSNV